MIFLAFTESLGQRVCITLFEPVFAPQCQSVYAKLLSNFVDIAFHGKTALRSTITTETPARCPIRIHNSSSKPHVWTGIDRASLESGVALGRARIHAIGCAVGQERHLIGSYH